MKFLAIVKLMLELLPVVAGMIRAIEDAVPGQGAGEAKLAALRVMLEGAYKVGGDAVTTFDQMWAVLQPAIASIVMALNATGWKR